MIRKKYLLFLIIAICFVLISSCATHKELTPLDIQSENDRSIYVDKNVWFWMVPKYFNSWYEILKLKKSICFRLEDYLKKVGWNVVGYHEKRHQKIYKVTNRILVDPYSGNPNYRQWIYRSRWRYKLKLSEQDINYIISSNYLLTFLIYPDPDNLYEYRYDIYLIKLKNPSQINNFLAGHNNTISFNDMVYNLSDKIKKIENRELLYTPNKIVAYAASSIFFDLKREGML